MPCAICRRQPRGFLWQDPAARKTAGPAQRLAQRRQKSRPEVVAFCSYRCQFVFTALRNVRENRCRGGEENPPEDAVIDATDTEKAAIAAALRPLGDYVVALGIERPLAAYRRDEILTLVEIVVDAFQALLLVVAEREAEREAALFAHLDRRRAAPMPHGDPF
jgi:hypothetical protein